MFVIETKLNHNTENKPKLKHTKILKCINIKKSANVNIFQNQDDVPTGPGHIQLSILFYIFEIKSYRIKLLRLTCHITTNF